MKIIYYISIIPISLFGGLFLSWVLDFKTEYKFIKFIQIILEIKVVDKP